MPVPANRTFNPLAALIAGVALAAVAAPLQAQAQGGYSREVVQPLPSPQIEVLNGALKRISRNPKDIAALVDAGNASVKLDDMDAAEGFFSRAAEINPNDPRVQAGMAKVLLRDENPFDAIRLFDAAERGGVPRLEMAADRGLAYDLVGNNAAAQAEYKLVLDKGEDEDVRKRYALSLAIAGNQPQSDTMLLPLLQKQDLSAYRARAFALAALGKTEEAVSIAEAILPSRLSSRMAPYLRYMPKLTRAQQAAAANLGNFPKAQDVGHDDPRIAQLNGNPPQVAAKTADAKLIPGGQPLGSNKTQAPKPAAQPKSQPVVQQSQPVVQQTQPAPAKGKELPPLENQPARQAVTVPATRPAPAVETKPATTPPPPMDLAEAFADFDKPATIKRQAGAVDITSFKAPRELPKPPEPAAEAPKPEAPKAEAAKSNKPEAAKPAPAKTSAAKVEKPKAEKPEPKKEPAKPQHPSRIWVQVATGRDISALGFDWRRISRGADGLLKGKSGYTAAWGDKTRLLTGPFDSRESAQELVEKLKEANVDSFMYLTRSGDEVTSLPEK